MHFFLAIFQYKHKVIEKRFVEVKDNVNSWDKFILYKYTSPMLLKNQQLNLAQFMFSASASTHFLVWKKGECLW